jgi:type IV secretory pathway VirB10-like protein
MSIYLFNYWVLLKNQQTHLENLMISRFARLSFATVISAAIGLSPIAVMAADPAPAPVPVAAPIAAPATAPSAQADKAAEKKAKQQAKKDKKAKKRAEKKAKKKAKNAEAAQQ